MTKKWSFMGVSDQAGTHNIYFMEPGITASDINDTSPHTLHTTVAGNSTMATHTDTCHDGTCTRMWFPRCMHVIVCSFDPNPYPTQWQPYSTYMYIPCNHTTLSGICTHTNAPLYRYNVLGAYIVGRTVVLVPPCRWLHVLALKQAVPLGAHEEWRQLPRGQTCVTWRNVLLTQQFRL